MYNPSIKEKYYIFFNSEIQHPQGNMLPPDDFHIKSLVPFSITKQVSSWDTDILLKI
jgi:hypothetical protein